VGFAGVEHNGIKLDTAWWARFDGVRERLLLRLVQEVDRFGIFDGLTFKHQRFHRLLAHLRIPWERTQEGGTRLLLEADYFRDQAELYPILAPLHLLRQTLTKLRKPKLSIGPDGRNRTLLGPWGTVTGRNAFSTNKSIFGPDRWTRFTILPPGGSALAYVDWSAQEIGIAAFLSGDNNLLQTYLARDPYLHFGKLTGSLPEDAERGSVAVEQLRDKIKILFLGMGYGMGLRGLVWRLGGDRTLAERMWQLHHQLYAVFWRWVQRTLDAFGRRHRRRAS
jgi:DNA polymerase-1